MPRHTKRSRLCSEMARQKAKKLKTEQAAAETHEEFQSDDEDIEIPAIDIPDEELIDFALAKDRVSDTVKFKGHQGSKQVCEMERRRRAVGVTATRG